MRSASAHTSQERANDERRFLARATQFERALGRARRKTTATPCARSVVVRERHIAHIARHVRRLDGSWRCAARGARRASDGGQKTPTRNERNTGSETKWRRVARAYMKTTLVASETPLRRNLSRRAPDSRRQTPATVFRYETLVFFFRKFSNTSLDSSDFVSKTPNIRDERQTDREKKIPQNTSSNTKR